jgi:hypothetical protein
VTLDEIEALLRQNVVADLGEARAAELTAALRSTAEALALVLSEPIGLEEVDPDFVRPLA